jgi:hypothetical protein
MPSEKFQRSFAQSFDFYANPVQLSYNGSRRHHTVPGAICSIISMLLMSLMFWGVFRKMTGHDYTNVVRNNH